MMGVHKDAQDTKTIIHHNILPELHQQGRVLD